MKLDPPKTAILTLDLQTGVLAMGPGCDSVIPNAAKLAEFARTNGYLLIHVGLGFSQGHPEIPNNGALFSMVKKNNLFVRGASSAEFHKEIFQPGDLVVYKQRVGAFTQNDLDMILRCQGIENLVLFGIATSGIVLATVVQAFDRDFKLTVIEDACFDSDPEVHCVLMEKYIAKRGSVVKTDAFLAEHR
jgi:nicotinamidase-related amidase